MESTFEQNDVVYNLVPSPRFSQDGVCFLGRASGLYRSSDGCATWQDALASLGLTQRLAVTSVALSPDFATDQRMLAGVFGGVLHSEDGGLHWGTFLFEKPEPLVSCLAVSPAYSQDGTAWVGTLDDGIYLTRSHGSRWAAWNFGLFDPHVLALAVSPDFSKDQVVYAATETGIFISRNAGRSWQMTSFPTEAAPVTCLGISPGFGRDGILLAGTEEGELYGSPDRGKSWARKRSFQDTIGGLILAPNFSTLPGILVLSGVELWFSTDGGTSWEGWKTNLPAGLEPAAVAVPYGLQDDTRLLVAGSNGQVLQV